MTADAIVAGGGIVGAACAAELIREGFRVTLVEPSVIGGGATAAGMGHLAVMDDSEAQFALTRYSQVLWRELAPQLPRDAEYFPCGSLWIAADDEEMAEVFRKQAFYRSRNVPCELLDAQSVAEAEPNLRPGFAGALRLEDDAVIYPPCAARFLVAEADSSRLTVIRNEVISVDKYGVRLDDGTSVSAGFTIIATGVAAVKLIPIIKVQPRKGHLVITDRYPGFVKHQLIELGYLKSAHSVSSDSVAFNVQPRRTGQLLIGSSRQYANEDPVVDSRMLNAMLSRAVEYMPGLAQIAAIRCWTGFRAATPDKLPLIGPCPGFENVYVATGHEGLGISTSLATAKLIGDHVLGRKAAIPLGPYLPERAFAAHV